MKKKPLVVIIGPTAVGKTGLSIELAAKLNGEIVSADSMQIYKMMDIGTAKPTMEERKGIKHYLMDEIFPDEEFSVAQYKDLANHYITKIHDDGKLPIMVGGTGLYINSVVDNVKFSETVCDWDYRKELQSISEEKGNEVLHQMLEEVDPVSAARLHINDQRRIIRALEVFKYTGIPISAHQEQSKLEPSPYDITMIGLTMNRTRLYERINLRVDLMLDQGLLDEVKMLLDAGYTKEMTSMKGLGYKEIIDYLSGITSLEEAVEILKRDTRRYAKRQLTWFRRDARIHWIEVEENNKVENLVEKSLKCMENIDFV